jgi:hypothetical protein
MNVKITPDEGLIVLGILAILDILAIIFGVHFVVHP